MKAIYIIFKNDVEINNRDYEYGDFKEDYINYLNSNSISDYCSMPVFFSESEQEAKDYLKNRCATIVSGPMGNHPKTLYREFTYYDLSKVCVTDEDYNRFDGDLEKIYNENEEGFPYEEWAYDVSEL